MQSAKTSPQGRVKEVAWHEHAPQGKMDLVVDLNFRMDTSALYSDIILPAATWYEKADLNSTDMHSFIHPLSTGGAAVLGVEERLGDLQGGRQEVLRSRRAALPRAGGGRRRDSRWHTIRPAEIAQPDMKQWIRGEGEAIPGKTMPGFKIVKRDYKNVYNQFISYGPLVRENGLGAHGTKYSITEEYDEYLQTHRTETWDGKTYPSLDRDVDVCDAILHFATVTNGELAYRSYQNMEEKTGLPLAHLAEKNRGFRTSYKDIQSQPRRFINSPMWSGLIENGRTYSPFTYNVESCVPWRTLTGRQSFYLDHPVYIDFGEHLPTYKPKPLPTQYSDLQFSETGPAVGPVMMLNYPDAAREMAHPFHLRRQPADDDAVARHLSAVDERQGCREPGHRRQRLGRSVQRPRRGGDACGGQCPHPARYLHAVPRPGADPRHSAVTAAQEPAGRRTQQSDAHPAEAELHDRRLRPVYVSTSTTGDRLAATVTRICWCENCPGTGVLNELISC